MTKTLFKGGKLLIFVILIIGLISFFAQKKAWAGAVTQRQAFLAALANLQQGKQQQFLIIAQNLRHYPLYPYLVYADIVLNLSHATSLTINNFLITYVDTPLAGHLRNLWLAHLAQQQRWREFLTFYVPTHDIYLQCDYRQALWESGQTTAAIHNFVELLSKNNRLPQSCLTVLTAALHQGTVGENLIWQRIALAFQQKDLFAAHQYANLLSANNKKLFVIWQRLYQQPEFMLQPNLWQFTGNLTADMLQTALQRAADTGPQFAMQLWQQLKQHYTFSFSIQQRALRVIAMALAEAHDSNAYQWLALISPENSDNEIAQWRVRSALYLQHWNEVHQAITQLPLKIQQLPAWRYWLARALFAQGDTFKAREIYRNLALQGDFYGQLASLQLNQAPLFALKNLRVAPAQVVSLTTLPAIQRAYELYQLHWLPEAHQEWNWALNHLPQTDYLAAAELALQWGWFDQAITTVKHINDVNNIALRFPLAYRENILTAAKNTQLNPAWMFALIRQESLFSPQVRSSAGALGLMQLLPTTGELIAHQLHFAYTPRDLLDANFNLLLGSIYLKRMLMRFNGNVILATAAYNAGPNRVMHWLPPQSMPADIWIEVIPWQQTRDYVKNIMASTTFYEKELGLRTDLAKRLTVIE